MVEPSKFVELNQVFKLLQIDLSDKKVEQLKEKEKSFREECEKIKIEDENYDYNLIVKYPYALEKETNRWTPT